MMYLLLGLVIGLVVGFCVSVKSARQAMENEKWDSIKTGAFTYDDRIYEVKLRK